MSHYVRNGNSLFEMETITEFDISKERENQIIATMQEEGWKHYKTYEHHYGPVTQYNVIFAREVKKP